MTDKEIKEAVENCFWRKKVAGIYVCSGDVVPCEKNIDDGKCDTLIKLFAKERDNNDD